MIKWFERHNWIALIISIAIAVFIFYISGLQGGPAITFSFPLKAVIYHIGIFFLFCMFLMIALSRGKSKDWLFFAIIFSFFYGITDELHQHFVPGRHVSVGDFLINAVGITFASLIYYIRFVQNKSLQLRK
jgi:VanZ family protein